MFTAALTRLLNGSLAGNSCDGMDLYDPLLRRATRCFASATGCPEFDISLQCHLHASPSPFIRVLALAPLSKAFTSARSLQSRQIRLLL
ncbi:hypothetical protein C8R46DRAFT_1070398 [Mycena filopes]|nr:hypothetical protein C8R46DRAFT_1070398 [Mycena filopes]